MKKGLKDEKRWGGKGEKQRKISGGGMYRQKETRRSTVKRAVKGTFNTYRADRGALEESFSDKPKEKKNQERKSAATEKGETKLLRISHCEMGRRERAGGTRRQGKKKNGTNGA